MIHVFGSGNIREKVSIKEDINGFSLPLRDLSFWRMVSPDIWIGIDPVGRPLIFGQRGFMRVCGTKLCRLAGAVGHV